jgi:hypothetical protein
MRRLIRKTYGPQKIIGEIRPVANTFRRIIQRQRVDRLNLDAADAALFHRAELARQFRIFDSRPKPPPAHHDVRIVRWLEKTLPQRSNRIRLRATAQRPQNNQGQKE